MSCTHCPNGSTISCPQGGATDIVESRGEEANQSVLDLTGGIGADASLECVGTQQSVDNAAAMARPRSTIGIVGGSHGDVPSSQTFFRRCPAPARIVIPELLDDVPAGTIDPGLVLDYETDLEHTPEAYAAMDESRAITSLIRVGSL